MNRKRKMGKIENKREEITQIRNGKKKNGVRKGKSNIRDMKEKNGDTMCDYQQNLVHACWVLPLKKALMMSEAGVSQCQVLPTSTLQ